MSVTEKVLLQNDWRTPLGRFNRSINGVPVDIPVAVLKKYALPSTAKIVDDNYVPPLERGSELVSEEMTAAEMEAEINRRVTAQQALEDAKRRGREDEKLSEEAGERAEENDEDMLRRLLAKKGYTEEQISDVIGHTPEEAEEAAKATAAEQAEKQAVAEAEAAKRDMLASTLEGSVAEVAGAIEELPEDVTVEDMELLRSMEEAGKNRKGVLISIEAAIEDLTQLTE